ncbi:hypothetical protein NTJ12_002384 [Flavobacterium psychrophilum]|nr:hypothetical protein [Flavobacterium psychrophilum]
MNNFDIEQITKEEEARDSRMKQTEYEGLRDIIKYFDRIHSNLFTYNNILIAGFFTLAQLNIVISKWSILIPICNLWFLIYIDYRMMEKSRFEASITNQPFDKYDWHGRYINNTNLMSFLSILTTFLVTIAFLYYLIEK